MTNRYVQLFLMGLWLGLTVFGGVSQAYPIIREQVTQRRWLAAGEVDAIYALGTFLPGPSFLNLWGGVAARVGGFWGALLGQVGLILPASALVCLLPLLGRLDWVSHRTDAVLMGTVWATVGLLLGTSMQGLRQADWAEWMKVLAAFALLWLGIHPLLVLAGLFAWGAAGGALRTKEVAG